MTLGKSVQLPCKCPGVDRRNGKRRVEWEDSRSRVIDLEGKLPAGKFTLLTDKRRLEIKRDCSLYIRQPQPEDQGDYKCSFYDSPVGSERPGLGRRVHIVSLVILGGNASIPQTKAVKK